MRARSYVLLTTCVVLASGCVAVALPPLHTKVGAARLIQKIPASSSADPTPRTIPAASIGLDSATVFELPVTVGAGAQIDGLSRGLYGELGWIHRIAREGYPLRVGATAGGELLWSVPGKGLRAGITIEWASRYMRDTKHEEKHTGENSGHDDTEESTAVLGSLGIGAFVDVARRWLDDEPDAWVVTFGITVRSPAFALFASAL